MTRFPRSEDFNEAKALAHQHHVFAKLALTAEILPMRGAPPGEAAIAFAFIGGERRVHVRKAAIGDFGRLDDATRRAAAVAHDPLFARR